jgi:O-antigen ligase
MTLLFSWLVSMVLSAEFVLSLSMIGLLLLALLELRIDGPSVRLQFRAGWQEVLARYRENPAWWVVAIPFLLVLVSLLWSEDRAYTLERLRIKLPFLVLPFAFAGMPALQRREVLTILYFLLVLMGVTSLYVLFEFFDRYEEVMADIGRGGHLPTPSNHIRYSLTVVLAILGGVFLLIGPYRFRYRGERWLVGGLTLYLFLFLHLLSVRSGILSFYASAAVLLAAHVLARRKYRLGLALAVLLAGIPLLAYRTIPSFRLKVDYAYWDYLQFRQGIGGGYPDAERLTSMLVGMEIGREHMWTGVGAGDLRQEVKQKYASAAWRDYSFRMPHNQLVTVFAGTGIPGLMLFLCAWFYPLLYRGLYRQPAFLAFHAVIFLSLMVENTFENNFGVSLYLFFLLIGLNHLSEPPSVDGANSGSRRN